MAVKQLTSTIDMIRESKRTKAWYCTPFNICDENDREHKIWIEYSDSCGFVERVPEADTVEPLHSVPIGRVARIRYWKKMPAMKISKNMLEYLYGCPLDIVDDGNAPTYNIFSELCETIEPDDSTTKKTTKED